MREESMASTFKTSCRAKTPATHDVLWPDLTPRIPPSRSGSPPTVSLSPSRLGNSSSASWWLKTFRGVIDVVDRGAPQYPRVVDSKAKQSYDRAARLYRKLRGARDLDDAELWQHALFFAMSPQERCRFSLETARSSLSLRRSGKKR